MPIMKLDITEKRQNMTIKLFNENVIALKLVSIAFRLETKGVASFDTHSGQ